MKIQNVRPAYSSGFNRDDLLRDFLDSASLEFDTATDEAKPILEWVKTLTLGSRPFQVEGHEYELAMLEEDAPRQCYKKGAQMGFSEVCVLKSLHGLIYSRYPQGVLYLFPTVNDVTDFSKGRFGPLIEDNPGIGDQVSNTDAVGVKRIRRAMLYLRGARSTGKIEGVKRTSSQLKSVPVDRVVFDEVDEMDPQMVDLAVERLSHSLIKEEAYLSTPSIPDFGIDKLFNESDQRVWMIKCDHCGRETCLEAEFPNSLLELPDGQVIRSCKKCKKEIFPRNGRWVPQCPERSKDLVGWWISQLNSAYVDPASILKAFSDPSNRNLAETYNSKLAMAYIAAENRLTVNDIFACCGQEAMQIGDVGPCAMGVDVGKVMNVVIGFRPRKKVLQICHLARVSSFNDLHDLAKRFNVRSAVIDLEPETRAAREFQASQSYPVFLCDYVNRAGMGLQWDMERKLVKGYRTEICDTTHNLIARTGELILPRRCEEMEIYARQMTSCVKVLTEDPETGSRDYRYRKIADDHYFHATGYFHLASLQIGISDGSYFQAQRAPGVEMDFDVRAPFGSDNDHSSGFGRKYEVITDFDI